MAKGPNIIVVGAGVAGQMAALKAAECGAEVLIFSDAQAGAAPSSAERNGINAALDTAGEGDSPALHAADTIRCGDFLAHPGPVQTMCAAAPMLASLFDRMGVAFDRSVEGLCALLCLSGSSRRRSLVAGARTGHHVQRALYSQLLRQAAAERLRRFEGWEFLSPVLDDGGACRGIVAADRRNMEIRAFAADAVVICAGGYGGLFGRIATRPASDGGAIGACYERGTTFANPEFVQIVPHAIPGARRCYEVGESDLAGRISGDDPWEKPMEAVPAVGRSLGGLWVDARHATSIRGLFAAGAAAALYHGARALPGNELLADAYGGMVAGVEAVQFAAGAPDRQEAPASLLDAARAREEDVNARLAQQEGGENAHALRAEAGEALASAAFLDRGNPALQAAGTRIRELEERFVRAPLQDRSEWANDELLAMRRIRRGLILAGLVCAAAAAREESRGTHLKPAAPKRDDARWQATTKARWSAEGHRLDHSERIEIAGTLPAERRA